MPAAFRCPGLEMTQNSMDASELDQAGGRRPPEAHHEDHSQGMHGHGRSLRQAPSLRGRANIAGFVKVADAIWTRAWSDRTSPSSILQSRFAGFFLVSAALPGDRALSRLAPPKEETTCPSSPHCSSWPRIRSSANSRSHGPQGPEHSPCFHGYDAWFMEEDCKLSERIVSEYQGLNLSRPRRA
jgi:hypothetical protein